MKTLALICLSAGAALVLAAPAVAQDVHRESRHDRGHDQLEDRHDDGHDRLEERHDEAHEDDLTRRQHRRLHNKLERKHDQGHNNLERRHDEQHGGVSDPRYGRYPGGYGDPRVYGYPAGQGYPSSGGYGYPRGGAYGGYGNSAYRLRGDGWAHLGGLARDPRIASWVLRNFDYNRNGSLGAREGQEAYYEITRRADRDRDGRLTQRELDYWRIYAGR